MSNSNEQEGRVAVIIRCAIHRDEENNAFVAHFRGLGLIARGQTEEEAERRCKKLFNKFVRAYRSVGQLEMRLNQADAKWWWLGEYPKEYQEPENTDLLAVRPAILSLPERQPTYDHFRKAIEEARQQEEEHSGLAVAA